VGCCNLDRVDGLADLDAQRLGPTNPYTDPCDEALLCAALGGAGGGARREAAPLRQARAAARAQDGACEQASAAPAVAPAGEGAGELVPGAPATFAVWELAGELVVQKEDPAGGVVSLGILREGEVAGEISLLKGVPATATLGKATPTLRAAPRAPPRATNSFLVICFMPSIPCCGTIAAASTLVG